MERVDKELRKYEWCQWGFSLVFLALIMMTLFDLIWTMILDRPLDLGYFENVFNESIFFILVFPMIFISMKFRETLARGWWSTRITQKMLLQIMIWFFFILLLPIGLFIGMLRSDLEGIRVAAPVLGVISISMVALYVWFIEIYIFERRVTGLSTISTRPVAILRTAVEKTLDEEKSVYTVKEIRRMGAGKIIIYKVRRGPTVRIYDKIRKIDIGGAKGMDKEKIEYLAKKIDERLNPMP